MFSSSTNDILSLKKEIVRVPFVAPGYRAPLMYIGSQSNKIHLQARGSIGSMIPLLYVQSRNAQTAVDQTTKFLAKTVQAFEQTMQDLSTTKKSGSDEQASDIADFIKGCQFYCSGNLTWRYSHPMGICVF